MANWKDFGILWTNNTGEGLIVGMPGFRTNVPRQMAGSGTVSVAPYRRALV
jgi:hypothetical protein